MIVIFYYDLRYRTEGLDLELRGLELAFGHRHGEGGELAVFLDLQVEGRLLGELEAQLEAPAARELRRFDARRQAHPSARRAVHGAQRQQRAWQGLAPRARARERVPRPVEGPAARLEVLALTEQRDRDPRCRGRSKLPATAQEATRPSQERLHALDPRRAGAQGAALAAAGALVGG